MPLTVNDIWIYQIGPFEACAASLGGLVETVGLYASVASGAYDLTTDLTGLTGEAQASDARRIAAATGSIMSAGSNLVGQLGETPREICIAQVTMQTTVATATAVGFLWNPTAPYGNIMLAPWMYSLASNPYTYAEYVAYETAAMAYNAQLQAQVALANGADTKGNLKTAKMAIDLAKTFTSLLNGPSGPGGGVGAIPTTTLPADADAAEVGDRGTSTSPPHDHPAHVPTGYVATGLAGALGLNGTGPPPGAGAAAAGTGAPGMASAVVPTGPVAGATGGAAGGFLGGGVMGRASTKGGDDEDGRLTRQWSLTEEDRDVRGDGEPLVEDGVLS